MSTRAQKRANRNNSKRSTGPKTPAGKLASSRNNLRHGLAGRLIVADLSPEDAAEFNVLALSLRAEHAPATPTETLLVDRMTESFWMSSRAIALQSAALLSGDDSRLSLLLRYQTTHERAFSNASTSSQSSEKKSTSSKLALNRSSGKKPARKRKEKSSKLACTSNNSRKSSPPSTASPCPKPSSTSLPSTTQQLRITKRLPPPRLPSPSAPKWTPNLPQPNETHR